MTRYLFLFLGSIKGPVELRVVACLLVLGLVLIITGPIDIVLLFLRFLRERNALSQEFTQCERGHLIALSGNWKCACGLTFIGHAWQECPHCQSSCHAVCCPCGVQVVSPISPWKERR